MDLINGFGRASPGFGSDPPIGSDRAWGSLHVGFQFLNASLVMMCRPSILSLDTCIDLKGVTCIQLFICHGSGSFGFNRFLSFVHVRLCFTMVRVCGSFWNVVMALSLVVHIVL